MLRFRWILLLALSTACLDEGSPSTGDAAATCGSDVDCDDGLFCNGEELCRPGVADADDRGCVFTTAPCSACDEDFDVCGGPCAFDPDADGDGYDAVDCGGNDCDDTNASVHPGATELCDPEGVDEDCDPSTFGVRDADGDGTIDARCCNGERCGTDCDDATASVRPGASEVCNERDDDCDGASDEGIERTRYFPDADSDGYGAREGEGRVACARPEGFAVDDLDCDDGSADVSPVAAERCNASDDDCDGAIDELEGNTFYRDADGDGFGDDTVTMSVRGCVPPEGFVGRPGDCDDTRGSTHPGARELCNGVDDDCSSVEAPGGAAPSEDGDGDLHSPPDATCEGGFPKDDCDDSRAVTFAGAPEFCSGYDDDCDGSLDEGTDAQCASGVCEAGCVDHTTLAMHGEAVCAIDGGVPHCWGRAASSTAAALQYNVVLQSRDVEEATPVALPLAGARSIALSSASSFACTVLLDGSVRCWGGNEDGELGVGDTTARNVPVAPLGLTDVVQVAASVSTVCALDRSGTASCWGDGTNFALGDGSESLRPRPGPVLGLDRAVELVGAAGAFCARRFDGGVWCWGSSPLGDGEEVGSSVPRFVLGGASALAAGGSGSRMFCARRADGWWCWGLNTPLDAAGASFPTPTPLRAVDDARSLGIGGRHACATRADRSIACWGDARALAPDGRLVSSRIFPAIPSSLPSANQVACGNVGCCVYDASGLFCRGRPDSLFFGDGEERARGPVDGFGLDEARSVALGHTTDAGCIAASDGSLRCFGGGGPHLGLGPVSVGDVYVEPVVVAGPSDVVQVDTSVALTCARSATGAVWCWGGDAPPGDGSLTRATTPRLVDASAMGPVSTVAVGPDFACALDAGGHAWCWGASGSPRGALCGAGPTVTACPRPVAVAGGHAFRSLDADRSHVCGLRTDGQVFCWGFRGSGALGDGATTGFANEPVRSGDFTAADAIAVGANHTCILEAGHVRCVGSGGSGQLGHGSTGSSTSFVDVLGLSDATEIRCRNAACFARRTDSSWVAWGNDAGLLGAVPRRISVSSPVPAAHGLTGELWLGATSACARRAEHVSCWGSDASWEQRSLPLASVRSAF
ncbi:MAG: hypothetical protein H6722_01820 [Sandaracinus sp.]|nr:hypothetical protein [Sandaracinus sp.]MCB9604747.1 hypothetical protein [Sandaracinus sp.]MCB9611172.1 hypothetical protein [Sandaracinus sp.]MCB9620774.1 hypothetical protein [Sandaracinus sp.]MCB9623741.1 hypothetical protein [Sandaracinus sp.]